MHWAGLYAVSDNSLELFHIIGDPAARTSQGKGRPDDHGITDCGDETQRFLHRIDMRAPANIQPNLLHGRLEHFSVFSLPDHLRSGPNELCLIALQHSPLCQFHGQIQGCLAAQGRQNRVRTLFGDHPFQNLKGQRLDIRGVGHIGIRHDRSRVAVDQNNAITFLL